MNEQNKVDLSLDGISTRIELASGLVGGKKEFAKMIGISESQLYRYLSGDRDLKAAVALRMAKVAGVHLMWLLTGEGPMRGGDEATPSQQNGYTPEEAQKELQCMETIVEASYDKIQRKPSEFNELKTGIERIAQQANLDDSIRAQADNLLYLVFEDAAADQRRKTRLSKITMQMKERAALVQQAVDISGVEVSQAILELVKTLVLPGEPDASDIARLFKAIADQSRNN